MPKIRLSKEDCCVMTHEEIDAFCQVKGIDKHALMKLMGNSLWRHVREPWALLPAYNPSNMSMTWGILRAHLEGKLIPTKVNPEGEKYPQLSGSCLGLFGVSWLLKENPKTIVFTEGWRDAVAAVTIGLYATANSGGAYGGFKKEWLPLFQDKVVYIVMDRDAAGWGGSLTIEKTGKVIQKEGFSKIAARAIYPVAEKVRIIELPFEYRERHGKDLYDYVYEK